MKQTSYSKSIITIAVLQFFCGCASGIRFTQQELNQLELARKELKVLPVYAVGHGAGFPISRRNAISAAHTFMDSARQDHSVAGHLDCVIAAVAGRPMLAQWPHAAADLSTLPPQRDWVVLMATVDRFEPNEIDSTIIPREGEMVVLGGFPMPKGTTAQESPAQLTDRAPVIVAGRVLQMSDSTNGELVEVEVSPLEREGRGFSGGPAATVDDKGNVRVWGVIVRGGWRWTPRPVLRRVFALTIARLSQSDFDRFSRARLLNPEEEKTLSTVPTTQTNRAP